MTTSIYFVLWILIGLSGTIDLENQSSCPNCSDDVHVSVRMRIRCFTAVG